MSWPQTHNYQTHGRTYKASYNTRETASLCETYSTALFLQSVLSEKTSHVTEINVSQKCALNILFILLIISVDSWLYGFVIMFVFIYQLHPRLVKPHVSFVCELPCSSGDLPAGSSLVTSSGTQRLWSSRVNTDRHRQSTRQPLEGTTQRETPLFNATVNSI